MSTKKRFFAVDPGFAQTKYAVDGTFGVIPSAIAEPMTAMKSLGSGQRVHVTDRGKFVVGHDALEPGSKQIQSLDEDWLLKYLPVLILGALLTMLKSTCMRLTYCPFACLRKPGSPTRGLWRMNYLLFVTMAKSMCSIGWISMLKASGHWGAMP